MFGAPCSVRGVRGHGVRQLAESAVSHAVISPSGTAVRPPIGSLLRLVTKHAGEDFFLDALVNFAEDRLAPSRPFACSERGGHQVHHGGFLQGVDWFPAQRPDAFDWLGL